MEKQYVIVCGKKMELKEFKKMAKAKLGIEPKKREKKVTSITLIASELETMVAKVNLLKSIVAYSDNAYKQWGTIANTIMNAKGVRKPFVQVVVKCREVAKLYDLALTLANKNDKDVYQYVEKLGWKFDDIRTELEALTDAIRHSDVLRQFANHEAINGKGRRLGLQVLVNRSHKAMDNIGLICKRIEEIVSKGTDAFEYLPNGKRA